MFNWCNAIIAAFSYFRDKLLRDDFLWLVSIWHQDACNFHHNAGWLTHYQPFVWTELGHHCECRCPSTWARPSAGTVLTTEWHTILHRFLLPSAISADGYCRCFMRPVVCPPVSPSFRRRYRYNSFRVPVISLQFGDEMQNTRKQMKIIKTVIQESTGRGRCRSLNAWYRKSPRPMVILNHIFAQMALFRMIDEISQNLAALRYMR